MTESASLYYRDGGSDKVYSANLQPSGDLWVVSFAYGRRGRNLKVGSKTPSPVIYQKAKEVYDNLIKEKKNKGYTEDFHGTPFTGQVVESEVTGYYPQLLNPIERDEVDKYIEDDDWCAQEKFDGERRILIVGDKIIAYNKRGLSVSLGTDTAKAANTLGSGFYDGEIFGNKMILFDMPNIKGGYKKRYKELKTSTSLTYASSYFHVPYTAWTAEDKRFLFEKLIQENAEGIVFKKVDSPYVAGRPASGGNQLKYKFYETCSCMVGSVSETKRSVSLNVFDDVTFSPVNVGNVTVYPNQNIPKSGDIVEVRYLYFYPGGSLYQPVLLSTRNDIQPDECLLSKLKLKRDE